MRAHCLTVAVHALVISLSSAAHAEDRGVLPQNVQFVEPSPLNYHRLVVPGLVHPQSTPPVRVLNGGLGDGWEVVHSDSFFVAIPPGEILVVAVDGSTGEISSALPYADLLTESALEALDAAPAWVRPMLRWRLSQHEPAVQDALAGAILGVEDPRWIDEVAFGAAQVSVEDAAEEAFDVHLLVENARVLYAMSEELDYVDLVDVGDPGRDDDFHTTVRYFIGEGVLDVDRDVYYWHVVHPRFSDEPVAYVDPVAGELAPRDRGGVLWRSYYAWQDEDPARSPWLHFVTEHPNLITQEMLDAFVHPAQGYLTDLEVDPLVLMHERDTGLPVLVHYSWPGGHLDGTVIATTIPLEREYEEGRTQLLDNLAGAGAASTRLRSGTRFRVAIIKDRDPWGAPSVETALTAAGLPFDVVGSDEIDTLALGSYYKVIVPSAQPLELYQSLADATDRFRTWLKPGGSDSIGFERVLEIHGAIDLDHPDDDWCGIVLPGGFTCSGQLDTSIEDVELGGYPKLLDLLAGADLIWDARRFNLGGNDPIDPDAHALARIGYFGAQNLPDRCAEIPGYYGGPDNECTYCNGYALSQALRTQYPARTLYLHFGNCGEQKLVLGAAGRTGLVPTVHVDSYAQDHVWNEIFFNDRWIHYEIYRSDAGIQVDWRRDQNWGSVMRWWGDGYIENATPKYTKNTFTLEFTVLDSAWEPVDGASILLASEYRTTVGGVVPLVPINVLWTDGQGRASIELGTGRHIYIRVESPLGAWPGLESVSAVACVDGVDSGGRACEGNSSVVDSVYEIDVYLERTVRPPTVTESGGTSGDDLLDIDIDVGRSVLFGMNPISDQTFFHPYGEAAIDVYVVDQENLDLAQGGMNFEALHAWAGVSEIQTQVPVELAGSDYYLLLSNAGTSSIGIETDARVSYARPGGADDDVDASADVVDETTEFAAGGGCGCSIVS